jgi:hypothetical protein
MNVASVEAALLPASLADTYAERYRLPGKAQGV